MHHVYTSTNPLVGGMLTYYESTTTAEEAAAGLLLGYASCAGSVMQTQGPGTAPMACLPHPTTPAAGLEGGAVKVEGSACASTSADEGVSPDVAAAAWLAHLEAGRPVPDSKTLISLLKAMLESRALRPISSGRPDVKLVQIDTGKKFPHMLDTANGTLTEDEAIWTQCKTKMTHIAIRLCNAQGEPVAGSSVQEGGLDLRLTLHKIGDTAEPLSDEHNPRSQEGLFRGRASGAFEPTVLLMESRHEFRFQVMLLSSDIGGARMFVKVAPVRPDLAFNETLIVRSRSFVSRARMPDENFAKRQRLCPSPSFAADDLTHAAQVSKYSGAHHHALPALEHAVSQAGLLEASREPSQLSSFSQSYSHSSQEASQDTCRVDPHEAAGGDACVVAAYRQL